jgi:hypothetical protein
VTIERPIIRPEVFFVRNPLESRSVQAEFDALRSVPRRGQLTREPVDVAQITAITAGRYCRDRARVMQEVSYGAQHHIQLRTVKMTIRTADQRGIHQ